MVNMGRIHKEVGKFLMISLNLIKSDDESMIERGKWYFMNEDLKTNPWNQKSMNLTMISRRNRRLKMGEISETKLLI